MGTHFSFLFSIYSENHGVQAEPLNFTRSSDITYVPNFESPGIQYLTNQKNGPCCLLYSQFSVQFLSTREFVACFSGGAVSSQQWEVNFAHNSRSMQNRRVSVAAAANPCAKAIKSILYGSTPLL